ncbi:MAG: hypothetical protein R3E02_11045 [Blastomonas sp.]
MTGVLLLCGALAACSAGPQRGTRIDGPLPGRSYANPSKIVVSEIAFARLAQEKGQWTAFRETAADDALMFVPQAANAQQFLDGRADPPAAVAWQPHSVFMACDGRTGASTGAWQRNDGSTGYYTTVWQRQDGRDRRDRDEDWKWVLDHGDVLASPRAFDEMIDSRIASCTDGAMAIAASRTMVAADMQSGTRASEDGTFLWSWKVEGNGARTVTLSLWNGSGFDDVLVDRVASPAQ